MLMSIMSFMSEGYFVDKPRQTPRLASVCDYTMRSEMERSMAASCMDGHGVAYWSVQKTTMSYQSAYPHDYVSVWKAKCSVW